MKLVLSESSIFFLFCLASSLVIVGTQNKIKIENKFFKFFDSHWILQVLISQMTLISLCFISKEQILLRDISLSYIPLINWKEGDC